VAEIKTVPYVPLSHPFVERLIGTIRREYLDRILFWTSADLENKLLDFRSYFNGHCAHSSLEGGTPDQYPSGSQPSADLHSYRWQSHCRGLYRHPLRLDISRTTPPLAAYSPKQLLSETIPCLELCSGGMRTSRRLQNHGVPFTSQAASLARCHP
jgi:hypothetical protein